jgi:ABC-type histidine transport system ATPase subunit
MVGDVLEVLREVATDGMTMVVVTHEMGDPKHPRLQEFLSKVR